MRPEKILDDMPPLGLPVEAVLEELHRTLADNRCAVLQAPPGAGKTTCIPLALRKAPWLAGRKIIILAPRRLAARAAASRMADIIQEKVGQTIGYRIRMDSRVSAATRIEVVTEGVLTRMLQSDPSLEGVGLVIFDEFHERSLEADLGLAFCLDMQGVLNENLRLLIMSATLDTEPVAALLGHAPRISCPGRAFPIETRYVGPHTPSVDLNLLFRVVLEAVHNESGNILVFLPGAYEIRQVARRLGQACLNPEWIVAPLYGHLTRSVQDQAIGPPPRGRRKIVLATSIAETSLTIEGIRVVVDSGLQRVPRFDPCSGLTRLVTVPVSRASADQRRGRAGRTGPGVCVRLWSRQTHSTLIPAYKPEILEADLCGLVLELAIWGVEDPRQMCWLDAPSPGALDSARSLLHSLGALDGDGKVTDYGHRMAALPVHPRLAYMLVKGAETGMGRAACDLGALLGERDPIRFDPGRPDADLGLRFDLLQAARQKRSLAIEGATVDRAAIDRLIRTADQLWRRLYSRPGGGETASLGRLLAWAYPDRIARCRAGLRGKFLLANGRGAYLDPASPLAAEAFLVAAELDGGRREARIFKAVPYGLKMLLEQFEDQVHWVPSVNWDGQRRAVVAKRDLKLGALVLRSASLDDPDPRQVQTAFIQGIRHEGLDCLPWTKFLRNWQARVCFLGRLSAGGRQWPDLSDNGLATQLDQWLAPFLAGMTRLRDLGAEDLKAALLSRLTYTQQKLVDRLAPTHIVVPSGSRLPIDYSGHVPVLSVRVQEMFGLEQTPTVAGGRQPLLIHLLSPAGRPVQVTQDLAGFWQTGYPEVKKELKGRYPKHYWPDDPLRARATARVKGRGKK